MKTVYELEMHESLQIQNSDVRIRVLRVPGGWIYTDINYGSTNTFVPFVEEKKKKPVQSSLNLEGETSELDALIEFWNSKEGVAKCKSQTPSLAKSYFTYKKKNGSGSKEKLAQAIVNYSKVMSDPDSTFPQKWGLQTFLTNKNCVPKFENDGEHWLSYLRKKGMTQNNKNTKTDAPIPKRG